LVGSAEAAAELAMRVAAEVPDRFEIVGYIAAADPDTPEQPGTVLRLGVVSYLPAIISADRVELLVLAPGVNRVRYYEELTSNCLASGVRAADLDQFYERVFGDVPVTEINSCWFQHLVSLDRPPQRRVLRRTIDLAMVIATGIVSAPVLVLLVLLIRRDGGPALFRQVRIGEGGRPFVMLKLRTMRVQQGDEARWTAEQDPRITRIGRILRATHLDELPQLPNVLRGEMSVVGPRPEQPAIVDRLEALIPYYQRRHLLKPGVAGWAQARCGYAGSDRGSLRKVCHDLYYLRHRSVRFDLAILAETFYALLRGEPAVRVTAGGALPRFARERKRLTRRRRRRPCARSGVPSPEREQGAVVVAQESRVRQR